jgi:short-subunit dehydrogenase
MKRTIVITGATSGFGLSLVREFLKNGDKVIATGRNLTMRQEVFAAERAKYKDQLIEKNLDITSDTESLELKKYLEDQSLKIDVLINNAGHGLFGALEDLSTQQIRQQFEVNFFGLVNLTQLLLPLLIKASGKIFNFSSVFGFTGFPLSSAYCASKFAVEGFSESLLN